jgi:hypothetical protein
MRPIMFIGSSTKFLPVARAIGAELHKDIDSRVWDRGVFGLASTTLDELVAAAKHVDLATFVFGADDIAAMRDNLHDVARDNVVFELGMFMGAADRSRCFFVTPKGNRDFQVPTDLAGVTCGRFDLTLVASDAGGSVRSFCDDLRTVCGKLRSAYQLSGHWIHRWEGPTGAEERCELELLQLGVHVRGAFRWGGRDFELRGRIERDRVLSAHYRCLDGAQGYSGMLQIVLAPNGPALKGKWIGWSFNTAGDDVNAGKCTWTRA